MPPELRILRAPTNDSPYQSDRERKTLKTRRPRSVSMFNEPTEKSRLKPASWHHFRRLPPAKYLTEIKNRSTQPSELQVKLNSLKRNVWTGVSSEEKGPLSWGISSFAMNSYFTDSEALLKSCSRKLEELEDERKKLKDEKKKKKSKTKKMSLKVPNPLNELIEPINKLPKTFKKKGKLKHAKSESSPYIHSTSFTDVPIPLSTNKSVQKSSPTVKRKAKCQLKKEATTITSSIQSKKSSIKTNQSIISDNSESEDSSLSLKKVKKKLKGPKPKFTKVVSEQKIKI